MQQTPTAAEYFRPYSCYTPSPTQVSGAVQTPKDSSATTLQVPPPPPLAASYGSTLALSIYHHHAAGAMPPAGTATLINPSDETTNLNLVMDPNQPPGGSERAVPFPSINNLHGYHHPNTSTMRYGAEFHHPAAAAAHSHLYSGYTPGFDYMQPTTHIPINPIGSNIEPFGHQSVVGTPTSSQASSTGRLYPARPQPHRPLVGPDMSAKTPSMPPPLGSTTGTTSPLLSASTSASLRSQQQPSKDKANNNGGGSSGGGHSRSYSGNNNTSSAAANSNNNNNNPSPMAASGSNNSPVASPAGNKYRFPSGPVNSVQSVGSASSPSASGRGLTQSVGGTVDNAPATPSSALSSREGTPLPSGVKMEGEPAPNVDISRVKLQEPSGGSTTGGPPGSEFSPPAVPASSSLAQFRFTSGFGPPTAPGGTASMMHSSSVRSGFLYPGPTGTDLLSAGADGSSGSAGLTHGRGPRISGSSNPSGGSTASSSSSSIHGHVKIGRRPSHLPKVLKFSDNTLPPGWIRKLKQRKHGKQAGRWDVYIYSPCGVKFASRKKLKGFFEKNNLTHDPEAFDFTPYGRHIDSRVANSSGDSTASTSLGGGRHNSSGSTGSDGTHAGSSPASIPNYSPTHPGSAATGSMGYNPPAAMCSIGQAAAHQAAVAAASFAQAGANSTGAAPVAMAVSTDYATGPYHHFDPHMESPPNANALDIPHSSNSMSEGFSSTSSVSVSAPTIPGSYLSSLGRGHHHPIIRETVTGSEFIAAGEMDMDILGSGGSTNVASSYPAYGASAVVSSASSVVGSNTASSTSDLRNRVNSCEDVKPATSMGSTMQFTNNTSSNLNLIKTEAAPGVSSSSGSSSNNGLASGGVSGDSGFMGRAMSVLTANQDGFDYFYDSCQ